MSDELSARMALPFLSAGQAQKEIFHNEALARIDLLLHGAVESADLNVPPVAPLVGQCWIVAASPVGAWAGQAGAIAGWTGGGWRFCAPVKGMRVAVADRGHELVYGAGGWADSDMRGDGYYRAGLRVLSGRQAAIANPAGGSVIDVEGRAALGAILSMLRLHGLIESS